MPQLMQSNAVDTSTDAGIFATYWAKVKGYVNELLALPARIRGLRQEALGAKILADAKGATSIARTLSTSSTSLSGMLATAEAVVAKIRTWLPHWQRQESSTSLSGLGILPVLIIAPLAVAALAYVATNGLGLLKDYAIQTKVVAEAITGLKSGAYTVDQAAGLIKGSAPPPPKSALQILMEESGAKYIGLAVAGILGLVLYQRYAKKGA